METSRLLGEAAFRALWSSASTVARVPLARKALLSACERRLRERAARPALRHPAAVQADKLSMSLALLRVADRVLAERRLSKGSYQGLRRLIYDVLIRSGDERPKAVFRAEFGCTPPGFLTISPGKTCNLGCVGCYAGAGPTPEKLEWGTFERIVREAHDLWGTRFFVLSGGEPFAYRSEGKGILEMAERHPDCFFLMYTNGTLITDEVARRLGELGNLSPELSIEGMRERTDARRGRGVFDKVLAAIERLRREKVLFGLSLTATRENAQEILSDEVVELFFEKLGALYAWVFHYMPIGRAFTLEHMMTPEQRVRLWRRVWWLVREKRLFLADFWNSGTATNGCVAGGRSGGYLYINWDGAVSPCVFVPYAPVNIRDVYARGGTINDAWREPFFASIRAWQRRYGYREVNEPCESWGNWLMPCLIRDHHEEFRRIVADHRPNPTDDDARAALADPAYHVGLDKFDHELAALTDRLWEAEYAARATHTAGIRARFKPVPLRVLR